MKYFLCIGIVLFMGCGTILFHQNEYDNLRWARDQGIDLEKMTIRVPEKEWITVARYAKANPESPCFFTPTTRKIFIKVGSYVHAYASLGSSSHALWQTYEEYCLDHEVGHFRELIENIPFYSGKYTQKD